MSSARAEDGGRAVLASPGLHLAVAALALNDWVLKPAFGNALTGKLSDVAGLFAFALFWTALLPRRRLAVHLATAAGFAAWKSPLAQPLIDGWNAAAWPPVARTVDATDLVALAVLPLAWAYAEHARPAPWCRRPAEWAVVPLSLLVFAATTVAASVPMGPLTYPFAAPDSAVAAAFRAAPLGPGRSPYGGDEAPDGRARLVAVFVPATLCYRGVTADVVLRGAGDRTEAHFRRAGARGCSKLAARDTRWVFEACALPVVDAALARAGWPQPPRQDPGAAPAGGPPWDGEPLRCLGADGAP
jgi:hypothetical protein